MSIFIPPASLPCGGCRYCVNVHEKWQDFVKVDNVIPLAAAPTTASNSKSECSEDIDLQDTVNQGPSQKTSQVTQTGQAVEVQMVSTDNSYGIQYTTEQLLKEQHKDPDLHLILHWLNSKEEPEEADLFLASQAAKKYFVNKEQFFLDQEKVLRNRSKNNLTRLVVPKSCIQEVLALNHDIPMTGHQGVDRTRARIKEKYYWYKMNETIKFYVKSCVSCNKNKKATRKARCPMTQYHAGVPFERVHMDFIGPLPETTKGNSNILDLWISLQSGLKLFYFPQRQQRKQPEQQ